jgi:hypothetical protein
LSIKFAVRLTAQFALASFFTLLTMGQTTPPASPAQSEQAPAQEQNAQKPADKDKDQQNAQPSADQQGKEPAIQKEPAIHEETTPPTLNSAGEPVPVSKQQPKRILGLMPNFRAVSAGALPPPPTPKQSFMIATRNSFDYSSYVFVGITSGLALLSEAHPALGENGLPAYGRYYWRGFLDKTNGNYLVIFALPSLLHEDERYYAKGEGNGSFLMRGVYAATRILITPDYHGHNTFNASEVFGRAMAQGISTTYYPKADRTAGALAVKFGWSMGRDAMTNVFREYWPDIATHVFHRHP